MLGDSWAQWDCSCAASSDHPSFCCDLTAMGGSQQGGGGTTEQLASDMGHFLLPSLNVSAYGLCSSVWDISS